MSLHSLRELARLANEQTAGWREDCEEEVRRRNEAAAAERAEAGSPRMTSVHSVATPTKMKSPVFGEDFDRQVDAVKVPKEVMKRLTLEWLIKEALGNSVKVFMKEAGIDPKGINFAHIEEREVIKQHILWGRIEQAIACIIQLEPKIIDTDRVTHTRLLRLQLIELIRTFLENDTDENMMRAVHFAEFVLAPRVVESKEDLDQLARTMTVFILPRDRVMEHFGDFMDKKYRKTVWQFVNQRILEEFDMGERSKLVQILRVRSWADRKLKELNPGLEKLPDYGLDEGVPVDKSGEGGVHGAGGDDKNAEAMDI